MKTRTDFHAVNLSTGERTRSVVGEGQTVDETLATVHSPDQAASTAGAEAMMSEATLREALERIASQDARFMDNRNLTEWDIRCYVCKAYSKNGLVDGSYEMMFEHTKDCPIEIAKAALATASAGSTPFDAHKWLETDFRWSHYEADLKAAKGRIHESHFSASSPVWFERGWNAAVNAIAAAQAASARRCNRCQADLCEHDNCTDWECMRACSKCAKGPQVAGTVSLSEEQVKKLRYYSCGHAGCNAFFNEALKVLFRQPSSAPASATPTCPVRGDSCDAPCKEYPNCAAPIVQPAAQVMERARSAAHQWIWNDFRKDTKNSMEDTLTLAICALVTRERDAARLEQHARECHRFSYGVNDEGSHACGNGWSCPIRAELERALAAKEQHDD